MAGQLDEQRNCGQLNIRASNFKQLNERWDIVFNPLMKLDFTLALVMIRWYIGNKLTVISKLHKCGHRS